jgi:hypothetical protein
MMPMLSDLPNAIRAPRASWTDLVIIASLVGLDGAARVLPHAPMRRSVLGEVLFGGYAVLQNIGIGLHTCLRAAPVRT